MKRNEIMRLAERVEQAEAKLVVAQSMLDRAKEREEQKADGKLFDLLYGTRTDG